MEMAGKTAEDIDLIVFATTTPDLIFPSTACLLQKKLGISGGAAFDIQATCTGFVHALAVADKFIKSGSNKCVLVIGAETLSNILDWTDRDTCILFADGAGAVILEASEEEGILSTCLHTEDKYKSLLKTADGLSSNEALLNSGGAYTEIKGNEAINIAVTTLDRIVDEALEQNNLAKSDVDWLIPHQANIETIKATAKKLKMEMDQIVVTVDDHGNTSAASIPLALDTAVRDGRIQRGETIILEAFGGGFTWGSALIRY